MENEKMPFKKDRKRSQKDYTLGLFIRPVEKGEMTYKQDQKIYGIQGRSTVLVWLRKHGSLDWSTPNRFTMNPSNTEETPT